MKSMLNSTACEATKQKTAADVINKMEEELSCLQNNIDNIQLTIERPRPQCDNVPCNNYPNFDELSLNEVLEVLLTKISVANNQCADLQSRMKRALGEAKLF